MKGQRDVIQIKKRRRLGTWVFEVYWGGGQAFTVPQESFAFLSLSPSSHSNSFFLLPLPPTLLLCHS